MTGWALLAGIATLAALLATSGRPAGRGARQMLRSYAPLLPGVIVASAAVLVATWLPGSLTTSQPRWLSALAPVLVAAAFVLVVGHYRRPGRSTSRRSR